MAKLKSPYRIAWRLWNLLLSLVGKETLKKENLAYYGEYQLINQLLLLKSQCDLFFKGVYTNLELS